MIHSMTESRLQNVQNNQSSESSTHSKVLIIISLILLGIGLANLYSATGADLGHFKLHLKHLAIGLIFMALTGWLLPPKRLEELSLFFSFTIVLTLILVLLLGHRAGGAQRWLSIGSMSIQPSEFAKIALIMTVSRYFSRKRYQKEHTLLEIWPILAHVLLFFVLIFKQPDFGTAGHCLLIAVVQLCFVNLILSMRNIIFLFSLSTVTAILGWFVLLHPYQKLRILNLFNPKLDPSGSGYNSMQSLIAIGSGESFGKGFLQGTQSQLQFLPAKHTDFIFSVFSEEHGFLGSSLIFILFGTLAYVGLEIARNSRDPFGKLCAIGISAFIFLEFAINIAMVLGLFPVVGIPLPFFSSGGSSMLTVCIAIGILISIDRDNHRNNHKTMNLVR